MKHKILLGLTTTPRSDWQDKIREIEEFSIKEIALFPTGLDLEQREKLYELLANSAIQQIPHAHIRDDMEAWELELLTKKYKTFLFNIHYSDKFVKKLSEFKKYLSNIYIENNFEISNEYIKLLNKVGGICFDLAHYDDLWSLRKFPSYAKLPALLKEYPIGCCHVSAIRKIPVPYNSWDIRFPGINEIYSCHLLEKISEIDYVNKYVEYLPNYVSIELENSFKEQLTVKKRLETIING